MFVTSPDPTRDDVVIVEFENKNNVDVHKNFFNEKGRFDVVIVEFENKNVDVHKNFFNEKGRFLTLPLQNRNVPTIEREETLENRTNRQETS